MSAARRIYECTVMERPRFGERQPMILEGQPVSREIVAGTASKARYSYLLDLRDCWPEIRFQDIRVRSAAKKRTTPWARAWETRVITANRLIGIVASHGRHFFSENSDRREPVDNPFVAHFTVDKNGELWFVDKHTRKPILVRHQEWPGFSEGGTLRSIVEHLARHITEGYPINISYFSPSPNWACGGDSWGYGADMPKVRDQVQAILGGAA